MHTDISCLILHIIKLITIFPQYNKIKITNNFNKIRKIIILNLCVWYR